MAYQVLVRFPDVHKSVVERARVSPAVLAVCSRVSGGKCGFGETVRFLCVRGGKGLMVVEIEGKSPYVPYDGESLEGAGTKTKSR